MSYSGLFITGTDTDAGKTVVAGALMRLLQQQGLRVSGMKPIASGFEQIDGELRNRDVEMIRRASNVVLPANRLNRYAFEPAIAPHLAADLQSVSISKAQIKSDLEYAKNHSDVVVVEGVGGWKVPLSAGDASFDIQSLSLALELPVVMVVGMRLGCLNHALLTEQAILSSGAQLLGWVANLVDPDFGYVAENRSALTQRLSSPLLFELPHVPGEIDTILPTNYNSVLLDSRSN